MHLLFQGCGVLLVVMLEQSQNVLFECPLPNFGCCRPILLNCCIHKVCDNWPLFRIPIRILRGHLMQQNQVHVHVKIHNLQPYIGGLMYYSCSQRISH